MERFEQTFTVHPVGQGLFYSGIIDIEVRKNKLHTFKFVFDCGSENVINCMDEVEEFHKVHFKEDETLDLLVISHFDMDHVNHIHKLLEDRKVKQIITPFINFQERLFLALRYIEKLGPDDILDNVVLSIIIDPYSFLGNFLTGDGQFILINSDGENPPFLLDEVDERGSGELGESDLPNIDTEGKSTVVTSGQVSEINTKYSGNLSMMDDSSKVKFKMGLVPIMEFLFYRKFIGPNETNFYKKVYELFIEKYKSSFADPENPISEEINNVLKTLEKGKEIKKIFDDAYTQCDDITISKSDIKNLNTTALSMLHSNLTSFYKYFERSNPNDCYSESNIHEVIKFEGEKSFSRLLRPLCRNKYHCHIQRRFRYLDTFREHSLNDYPNSLLTSDSYLRKNLDVKAFCTRYSNYWRKYWLFQIPHHGSKANSGMELLFRVPTRSSLFVNYGVNKVWSWPGRHPSPELIADVVSVGHSVNLIPVNEIRGMQFKFKMESI
jgi:hypothetical protein